MKKQVIEALKRVKTPTKKTALSLIKNIMESGEIKPAELAQLYLYFHSNTRVRKPKTRKDFLANLIDRKLKHGVLRYIYSNGEEIVSSDGKILAVVPAKNEKELMKPGFYHPTTYDYLGDMDGCSYPNYKSMFSDNKSIIELGSFHLTANCNDEVIVVFDDRHDAKDRRFAISKKYFDLAKSYENLSKLESISVYDNKSEIEKFEPIRFKFEDGTFIILSRYVIDK